MSQVSRRDLILNAAAGFLVAASGRSAAAAGAQQPTPAGSERLYKAMSEMIFIPMRDGVKLTANLVRPERPSPALKYPALFTYDPYRATDRNSLPQLGYFAEHGYYCAHVDVRGTGTSQGREVSNEYSEQERMDAEDVIAWLAAQPWCNGNVGMFGTSYSGYNTIQIAMRGPPALKAIIPTFATDHVYVDDVIYYDGALQCDSLGRWPFSMIALSGLPSFPDYNTETSEAQYRVEQEPWIFDMLRHQTDDSFWQRMSLWPHYDAIKVPTFIVAGWLDQFTDAFSRMMEKMVVPRKAIVGPWTHGMGLPGPAINMQREALRWWDHWLKGLNTGVMEEPPVAMFAIDSYKLGLNIPELPGAWRYEDSWPVARVKDATYYPQADGVLATHRTSTIKQDLPYKPSVGMTSRYRCPHNSAELPVDQRSDDDYSMCFDTAKLAADMEILGHPKAVLCVSCTAPAANWIVRLCDVAPDGTSTLVSKGIINGTHRQSHIDPVELVPGTIYTIPMDLKLISWRFPKGHRIRFAVSNADFPNLWPTPYPMVMSLYCDSEHESKFQLPVCPPMHRAIPDFQPPEHPPSSAGDTYAHNEWKITRDEMARAVTVFRETRGDGNPRTLERRWTTVSDDNPANATIVAEGEAQVSRGSDKVTCKSNMTIESDAGTLHITVKRELFVNDKLRYGKSWEERIPRRFV